jgi:hypothetical protein
MATTMIYTAPTESRACASCRKISRSSFPQDQLRSRPVAQVELRALPSMALNNKSLVFGAAITRKGGACFQLCKQAKTAINMVNRLWYGRALVCLRTYQQESLRAVARQQHFGDVNNICNAFAA